MLPHIRLQGQFNPRSLLKKIVTQIFKFSLLHLGLMGKQHLAVEIHEIG